MKYMATFYYDDVILLTKVCIQIICILLVTNVNQILAYVKLAKVCSKLLARQ